MVNDSVPKLISFPNFGLVKVSMLPWSWTVPRLLVSKIFPERGKNCLEFVATRCIVPRKPSRLPSPWRPGKSKTALRS
jgi:hypothetical protein